MVTANGHSVRSGASGSSRAARSLRVPLTWPVVVAPPEPSVPEPGEKDDADRAERARAHEAAAEGLASRGEWERAYRHLRAAVSLSTTDRTASPHLPEQLHNEVDRLRRERAEAREQSRRDALTSGYNRRYLDERLAMLRGTDRTPGCVALADVDHFKQINDSYGHGLGDEVLRRLMTVMSTGLPHEGFCARYGGEEFALVLPDLATADAVALCEDLRARVDGQGWDDLVPGLRVTVSLGVADLADHDPARTAPSGSTTAAGSPPAPSRTSPSRRPTSALDAADALLYVAKRAGRNAVAFRDRDGTTRLAGPAAARRGLQAATRRLVPRR